MVAGGKESFAAIEAMIEKLDGESIAAANEFRVFYLKRATAAAVAPMVQTLFNQRVVRGQKDPVTVLSDAKSNSLVIGATPADMAMVESLITRLEIGRASCRERV